MRSRKLPVLFSLCLLAIALFAPKSCLAQLRTTPKPAAFAVAFVGGNAAVVDSVSRNGLSAGAEFHIVLKQEANFGVDFGFGVGYNSLSLPGGASRDMSVTASVGFTDCKYVSGGISFAYDAFRGSVSPAIYLALTYPVSDRVSLFGRGSLGLWVLPEGENFMVGRGQIGAAYHLAK